MFDYVSREKYEAEHDARIRAEAKVEALSEQVATLTQLLRDLNNGQTDLLDRVLPKPKDTPVITGEGLSALTAEEIMEIPAVGKSGIKTRLHWAGKARAREADAKKEERLREHREDLTDEELELVDRKLEMEK
jgi:hypothetical protein